MMRLYLDDVRPAPPGWIPVRNAEDFKSVMRSYQWDMISFDHDLSIDDTLGMPRGEITGYDLLVWMFDQELLPRLKPTVHSMNPVGAARMRAVIDDRW